MTFKLSAGVYPYEYVRGTSPFNAVNMTIGACTFASRKGPLGPHLVTGGWDSFIKTYGQGDYQWSPAHATLKPALQQMSVFYGNRVVNEALYAGVSLFYDSSNDSFFSLPFTSGSSGSYEDALRISKVVTFSDAIPSNKTVTLDLGDQAITQAFNQTSNYTLQLLTNQIQTALDSLGEGGSATVIKVWDKSDRKTEKQVIFNREFQAGDNIVLSIEGSPDITKQDYQVNFTNSSEETLQALADKVNGNSKLVATVIPADLPTLLITCANAGPYTIDIAAGSTITSGISITSELIREGHGVFDDRSIVITLPENISDLDISGAVAESVVTVNVDENAKVMDIFAENPGEWASSTSEGLGIKISNLDQGIQQRTRLTFSDAMVTGNEFTCTLGFDKNSWTIGPVQFKNNSDESLKEIASAIQSRMDEVLGIGGSVTVEQVVGGIDNDRNILIITPLASQSIDITDPLITGGISQALVTVKEIIPNTPSDETFTFEVYTRESLATPAEAWVTTLSQKLDSLGNQMFIEDMVNKGTYESPNIRVVTYTNDFSRIKNMDSIAWLQGGDDGVIPSINQIVQGWNEFADPEKVTVRILINGGYGNVNVHQAMSTIAQNRKDCVAILDMPSNAQSTTAALNYRLYEMNVNTSYAAIYSPDILVFDDISGTDVYVGPSGFVAAQICYTEQTRAIYWAPAGLNRGICSGAKGVRVIYGEADRDLIEPEQINPIRQMGSNGVVIMGEYTTQTASDPLSDLHVRLLCNNIEIAMTDALAYHLFEPNDEYLRTVMAKECEDYLQPIQDNRGIRAFRVISDITKESAADVDLGVAVVNIYIKPTSSTKFIRLNNYILGSGVDFEEVIENGV